MPIKMTTSPQEIRNYLQQQLERKHRAMIAALQYVGEACLKQARDGHKYINRTGNLASSVGYCIVEDGKIANESSWQMQLNGSEGQGEGIKYLHSLATQAGHGITFIMVAGMPYAQYVEAMGLDVLDSAEINAESMIPRVLKALFSD